MNFPGIQSNEEWLKSFPVGPERDDMREVMKAEKRMEKGDLIRMSERGPVVLTIAYWVETAMRDAADAYNNAGIGW